MKLSKELKKKMERELRQYDDNKKKLKQLKQDNTRKLLYLEERIHYVDNVYNRLRPDEKEVYNHIFNECCDWRYCQTIYNIDKNTYYSVYNKSIYYLAEEWGEI